MNKVNAVAYFITFVLIDIPVLEMVFHILSPREQ